jgi:hypothetical protein
MQPPSTVIPIPTVRPLDGEDKPFAEPMFEWECPFPVGTMIVSLPGWTVHAGDIMHFVATQFRHLVKSYRSFLDYLEEVVAVTVREAEEAEIARRSSLVDVSASPVRRAGAPMPAWCRGASQANEGGAAGQAVGPGACDAPQVRKKPLVFAEELEPCESWAEKIAFLEGNLFPGTAKKGRRGRKTEDRVKSPVSKKSPCWPLFSKMIMLVRSHRVVLKWA